MDIQLYEYAPRNDKHAQPSMIGLNIRKEFGLTKVSLFDVAENRGANPAHQLWAIAQHIGRFVLHQNPDNVDWSLTHGDLSTSIKFKMLRHQPLALEFSNPFAVDRVLSEYSHPSSLDEYRKSNVDPFMRERELSPHFRSVDPYLVFTIPFAHPLAKGGMFYCTEGTLDAGINRYTRTDDPKKAVIIANRERLLREIDHVDPEMRAHADIRGNLAPWLENNQILSPLPTGGYTFQDRRLRYSSGFSPRLGVLFKLEGLDYLPIEIGASYIGREVFEGERLAELVHQSIGYGDREEAKPHVAVTKSFGLKL